MARAALLASSALVSAGLAAIPAAAQTVSDWTGAANGNYANAGNWTGSVPEDETLAATFGNGAANTTVSIAYGGGLGVHSWTFSSATSYTFNISGSTSLIFSPWSFANAGIFGTAGNVAVNVDSTSYVQFDSDSNQAGDSTAGNATFNNSGSILFLGTSAAGSAVINNNNALSFFEETSAGNATITTANGATTTFHTRSSGGNAQFVTQAGGLVNFSTTNGPNNDRKISAGSIAGAGNYALGLNELTVGSNNIDGAVSGVISGPGGSLVKIGTATLTLSGNNTYTGGTALQEGTLRLGHNNALGTGNLSITGAQSKTVSYADALVIANLISLAGSANFEVRNADSARQAGTIGGAGALTKAGTGTLVLSGTNTYSGGTTVSAGTLQIGNGGATGSVSGAIVNDGTLIFNRSTTYDAAALGNAISGTGDVTLNGSGTVIFGAGMSYSGTTTVNSGTLIVNDSLAASMALVVNNGGVVGGHGTLPDTTIGNGGILSPGNSIGTITVNGDLTFQPGSTYRVEVGPAANENDRTNVTGTATLTGATVQAVFLPGSFAGRTYTILNAAGGLIGTFAALDISGSHSPARNPHLTYDVNNVYLVLDPGSIAVPAGAGRNQASVANAINAAVGSGATPPAGFDALLNMSDGQLVNALSQIAGSLPGGGMSAAVRMSNGFLSLMLNPFAAQGGARELGAAQLMPEAALAYAAATPVQAIPLRSGPPEPRWGMWGAAMGGLASYDGDARAGTADAALRGYGFAAGADYSVSPHALYGFALAGGGLSWSLAEGLGSGHADSFNAGVYGVRSVGDGYVAAALAYAWHGMTTDRTVSVGGMERLRGSFDAHDVGGRLEAGYRLAASREMVTPYAAVQAQRLWTPAYGESALSGPGTFALAYEARTATATRSELGFWCASLLPLGEGAALTLRARRMGA
jgi:outer membrane autotransporter protein